MRRLPKAQTSEISTRLLSNSTPWFADKIPPKTPPKDFRSLRCVLSMEKSRNDRKNFLPPGVADYGVFEMIEPEGLLARGG